MNSFHIALLIIGVWCLTEALSNWSKTENTMDEMFTYQEGLELAQRWGLESEYKACINAGMSPTEALEEWDLLPPETEEERE